MINSKCKTMFGSALFLLLSTFTLHSTLSARDSSSSSSSSSSDENRFEVTNLVSDIPGIAPNTDPNLVNPWGFVFDDDNIVVADNGTGLATSYTKDGSINSFVINVDDNPTGFEKNPSEHAFLISNGHRAKYLFSTESGQILAFNKKIDPNNAIVVIDRSSFGAVYKGLAIAESDHKFFLYATDFQNGLIDVWDSHFNFVHSFTDTTIPAGFAPFNIRRFDDKLYVTYAKQKPPENEDDQAGPGNGFVDIFNLDGTLHKRLVSGGELNSPWGLAIAPKRFGDFGDQLLVGNFGNGIINVYNLHNGNFLGQLKDQEGGVITINGLWGIKFDFDSDESKGRGKQREGVLYFTSGLNDESDGLIGKITVIKK